MTAAWHRRHHGLFTGSSRSTCDNVCFWITAVISAILILWLARPIEETMEHAIP